MRSLRSKASGDASNPPTDGSRDGPAVNGGRNRGPVARNPPIGARRMIIGVPRESFPGERRVALVPGVIPNLAKAGIEVIVQAGAGSEAGYPDADYIAKGTRIVPERAEVFATADLVAQVLGIGSNDRTGKADLPLLAARTGARRLPAAAGEIDDIQELAAKGRHDVLHRADAADHAGPEHGCALVDGDDRGLQGRRARGREAAADVPDAHHRGRDDHPRTGAHHRRRRGGPAGDRDGQAAGRSPPPTTCGRPRRSR